ncbi:putative ribonuclease H-like domain-containing protein [Tanacetum coccineum]
MAAGVAATSAMTWQVGPIYATWRRLSNDSLPHGNSNMIYVHVAEGDVASRDWLRWNVVASNDEGFAAVLAVLITGTSQSRQHAPILFDLKAKTISSGEIVGVDKFENASKSLNKITESQIIDNCKKGLGYNAVPPPLTGNFMPPKPDLSFTSLEEFTSEPIVIKSVVENSEAKSKTTRKNNSAPIIEDWISDSEEENVSQTKIEKKTAKPSFVKIDFVKAKQTNKTDRKTAKQVDCNYQRMVKPVRNNAKRVNHQNFAKKTHPCPKKNMVPRAVLMKPKAVVNAARPKAVVNAVKGNNVNVVKASACWVWKLKTKVLDHGNPQIDLQDKGVIDSGCLRHMTRNMSYLTDYEEIDMLPLEVTLKEGKSQAKVLLKVPRNNNMYSVDLKNIVPKGVDYKVKVIRCDNGSEFKNREMDQFCEKKGILRQYSVARTPQQNGVAEKRSRTLIEVARIMVADFKQINGKADEGFFVRYSLNSKAFRVFNSRTKIVEENLHIRFIESTPNVVGSGPDWLFDIDALTRTMNYKPIVACTQSNGIAGIKASDNAGQARKETELKVDEDPRKDSESINQEKDDNANNTNNVNAASTNEVNVVGGKTSIELPDDPNMPALEDYSIFDLSSDDQEDGVEADMNDLNITIQVSPIPTIRIHKDHPLNQVIGDLQSATQTRRMSKNLEEYGFVNAMQEELLQFKLQEVWTLVDLPNGKRDIGTKWVFRNKKDERGIVIRNKARLVAQGYTQEEGIDYNEVFAPVARIKAIRLFLAYASFKDFVVYQIDVKSAFLYGKIEKEVYVCQPPGFEDPDFPDIVYKQKKDGIFISQDKYVGEILKKFGFTEVKTASTPIETQKPLLKDEDGEEVDVHMYRSMIGSLMYLTSSRPDIMFAVCQPKLGLWYPKDSPFDLVAYTDSDYAEASLDRKSTSGVNAARHNLLLLLEVNAARHNLLLLLKVNAARYKLTTAKTVNGEVQLQALVDGKKIIITESIVRRDLQLEDAEGVDCLPNATIFEQLTLMGSKTTAWNEFSSTMASVIICLVTNQKFNFSKYVFESMVKNLDNVSGKFLMYLRFVQVFMNQQPKGMPTHKRIYIAPSHTKKIFRNMRRVGKGFSGRETPLFQTMMVQDQEEVGEADEAVNEEMDDSLERAATTATGLEAEQDSGNIDKTQSKATPNEPSSPRTSSGGNTLRSGEDSIKLQELMALCTTLQSRVLDLETTKTTQATKIASLKKRVKKLERRKKLRTQGLKRLYKVGSSRRVESSEEEGITLVSTHFDADTDMFGVHDLDGDEVVVESEARAGEKRNVEEVVAVIDTASTIPVSAATTTTTTTVITDDEITLAKALAELKSAKTPTQVASTRPKVKGIVFQDVTPR